MAASPCRMIGIAVFVSSDACAAAREVWIARVAPSTTGETYSRWLGFDSSRTMIEPSPSSW